MLLGLLAAAGFLGLLLIVQTVSFGRIGLEKMLTEMALPYGLLWTAMTLCIGASVLLWLRGGIRRAALVSLLGLWLATTLAGNGWIASLALEQTQYPIAATEDSHAEGPFDIVVVLGGAIGSDPWGRPQLQADGDRIRPALQLWHAGRVERIVLTGRATLPDQPHPSELTAQLLVSFGVPAAAIRTLEGRNTSEEMREIREFIHSWETNGERAAPRVGLVTSAFHMPRALRLARREGLETLVPLPVAYRDQTQSGGWARGVVPTAGALEDLSLCWKEWMAAAVGR